MPSKVLMPKTGADATEAKLLHWLKKDGEQIGRGDVLAEIETDKVNMEVEAFDTGTLHIIADEGSTHEVGTPIALLLKAGEQPPSGAAVPSQTPAAPAQAPSTPAAGNGNGNDASVMATDTLAANEGASTATTSSAAASSAPSVAAGGNGDVGGRIKASPLARRMAQEHDLDLARISGRGPGGRVVKEDVEVAIQAALAARAATPAAPPVTAPASAAPAVVPTAPATAAPVTSEPEPVAVAAKGERALSRLQLTAGRRLVESKQTAPHFYLTVEVDMAAALALRTTLNEQAEGAFKVSVNDLVIKATAWALDRNPDMNAYFRDGKLILHDRINISVAMALDDGLVSPVLPDVGSKSLGQIARDSRALIERARSGKLRSEDYVEASFTISNLGMFDIDTFIAIINPPQSGILAIGSVREVPVVRDGALTIGQIMKVTLSADHRATDGARGAKFLADFRRALEKPLLMAL